MEQNEHDIKPCPFCGKKPALGMHSGSYGYAPIRYFIKCECGAEMVMRNHYTKPADECKAELVNKWNKREWV